MTTKNSYLLVAMSAFAIILIMVVIRMLSNSDVARVDPGTIENVREQFHNFESYEKGEKRFPNIVFYTPDGKPTNIDAFEGRYLLMNVWATWCPGCVTELPALQDLGSYLVQKERPIDVIGVSVDREKTQEDVAEFLVNNEIGPFALYYDKDKVILRNYEMKGLPTTLLIDPEGNVVYEFLGEADWQNYHIMKLLTDEILPFATLLKMRNSP